ncbi:MAG: hypothetical protein N2053_10295 [Chitinispirillaceae bacterium]|nr:hypothetical protein [Chitinispirillaceae bacterium]
MSRKITILISLIFLSLIFTLPSVADSSSQKSSSGDSLFLFLTLEELAKYNGKDGKPSYVAIDSFVYDVTPVKPWRKGRHKGIHSAGTDLTEDIKKSPHGRSVLKKLKIIGKIVKNQEKK